LLSLDQSELEWVGVVLSSRTLIAKFIHESMVIGTRFFYLGCWKCWSGLQ